MLFPPTDKYPYRPGTAFTAVVKDVSTVDPALSDDGTHDFHVELTLDQVFMGQVPNPVVIDGSYNDCSFLNARALTVGDELFVVIDQLNGAWRGLFGQMLIYRKAANGWTFFEEAVEYGSDPQYYPARAREATTTAEILALVRGGLMPETTTASPRPGSAGSSPLLMLIAGGLGALAFTWRTRARGIGLGSTD